MDRGLKKKGGTFTGLGGRIAVVAAGIGVMGLGKGVIAGEGGALVDDA